MKRLVVILIILCTTLMLVSCAAQVAEDSIEDEQETLEDDTMNTEEAIEDETIEEEVTEEETLCGNDVCDEGEDETCEEDCIIICSENEDCEDDEVCGIGLYCIAAEEISEDLELLMLNWTSQFETKLKPIEYKEGEIQDVLDEYIEIIEQSEFESMEIEINEYFEYVENEVDVLEFGVADLIELIPDQTTRTSDEFFEDYSTLENNYLDLINDIGKQFNEYYEEIYGLAGVEEADLSISTISITEITTEQMQFSIQINNVGTWDAEDPFDVYISVIIGGSDPKTCEEEISNLDYGDSVEVECTIDISDHSSDFNDDGITMLLTADVDYNSEIDELIESNNDFELEQSVSFKDLT